MSTFAASNVLTEGDTEKSNDLINYLATHPLDSSATTGENPQSAAHVDSWAAEPLPGASSSSDFRVTVQRYGSPAAVMSDGPADRTDLSPWSHAGTALSPPAAVSESWLLSKSSISPLPTVPPSSDTRVVPVEPPSWMIRMMSPLLVLVVMLGYGLSFFINSIIGRFLHQPHWSTALLLNSSGRALTLGLVIVILYRRHPVSITVSRSWLYPGSVAFLGNLGFISYFALVDGGEVSVLTPMVGLYTIIPVIVGLLWRGEDRTRAKIMGIICSFIAVILLGFSGRSFAADESGGGMNGGTMMFKVAMFIITFVMWGVNDVVSSAVKLDPVNTAVAGMTGHLICAMIMALISLSKTTHAMHNFVSISEQALASNPANSTVFLAEFEQRAGLLPVAFGWPHAMVMFANALAIFGWMAFVKLGQIGQASSFIPVISMYTFIPVFLSVIFLGESINGLKITGLLFAGAAVVLIGRSWQSKGKDAKRADVLTGAGAELNPHSDQMT